MALDDSLLDDPARLAEADGAGLLRAVAMAGAQVRAATETAAELALAERLDVGRPRAIVLITRPGVGRTAMGLLAKLLAPSCPVPVVVADVVPAWIGALDVVIAHTDDPGDRELAASLERASRYGAAVVLSAPPEGPVASSIAGRGLLFSPRVPVPPGCLFPFALATGLLAANALGVLVADVESLADQLDAEAERDHLGHDVFVNPAKALALRLADRTPLLWGLDQLAVAAAAHGAQALAAHTAVVCDVAEYPQALTRYALHRAAATASGGHDIFADPDDAPTGPAPLRAILVAVRTGPAAVAARQRAEERLPAVDVVAPAEEFESDDATRAAVLALRFELASVYLGLAAGTIGGAGRYTPAVV